MFYVAFDSGESLIPLHIDNLVTFVYDPLRVTNLNLLP